LRRNQLLERRNGNGRQNRQNTDDNHQLDERETLHHLRGRSATVGFHGIYQQDAGVRAPACDKANGIEADVPHESASIVEETGVAVTLNEGGDAVLSAVTAN